MPMSTKRKAPAKLAAPVTKSSAKRPTKNVIDESRTSVSGADGIANSQPETIEISSDPASEDDISDGEESDDPEQANGNPDTAQSAQVNGKPAALSTEDADEAESDGEATSPTFGELLRGNEAIDVPALLQQSAELSNGAAQPTSTAIVPPSHQSLTTVLTQALKTDDVELLESCLHTTDLITVRNTIEGIDSTLAGSLLTKLASRLYRRPGRAATLLTWVQWTLVVHGGAIASQPKVIHGLSGLQKVLAERSRGLNSLLALKGKLDLLESQMDLRRRMKRGPGMLKEDESDSEDEDVIWVEGETENAGQGATGGVRTRRRGNAQAGHDDSDSDDEDMPLTNGVIGDSEDDEDHSDAEEDDSDNAEEPLDEDEVQYDEDDSMGEEDESDVDAAPPAKLQKVARSFPKRK